MIKYVQARDQDTVLSFLNGGYKDQLDDAQPIAIKLEGFAK